MKQTLKKVLRKYSFIALIFMLGLMVYLFKQDKPNVVVEASTVVTKGDFKLEVENKWDGSGKKSYASLNWDNVPDLSQEGYQLYQSEDGVSWNARSLKYGKAIKVLNIYPDYLPSNTLADWMDGLDLKDEKGANLIQVTAISMTKFNADPNQYLKSVAGDYQYDVLMFGSWDSNNLLDLSMVSSIATQQFIDSGRGVLFGHDTISWMNQNFLSFAPSLGVDGTYGVNPELEKKTGGETIQVKNDGYLMKYPFELPNQIVLKIPAAHNVQISKKAVGINWIMFREPLTLFNTSYIWEDALWISGWYLKTNNNVGMIQTGHSNGESTIDERHIIANTLYNLAQVSLDTSANDQTVKDDQAPNQATVTQKVGGSIDNFAIEINSMDIGKDYQWYIEASTKNEGVKKSDVVKEQITSNTAGYFYTIDTLPSSTLNTTVESLKDNLGRIDASKYDIYVAPTGTTDKNSSDYDPTKDANLVNYDTKGTITGINGLTEMNQYLHIVSVDRANNVSDVKTIQIKDIMTSFRITEKYQFQDASGQLQDLQNATFLDIAKGTNYSKLAPTMLDNWEFSAYKIDNGPAVNSPAAKIDDVKDHHTVTFIYKKAISTVHLRQVILEAASSLVVPDASYVDLRQQDNLFRVKALSGMNEDLAFTPIKLEMLTGYYTYQMNPVIPEYYQYKGYLLTDTLQNTGTIIDDGTFPTLDYTKKKEYWVTVYLEPISAMPKPHSWTYQEENFGKVQ